MSKIIPRRWLHLVACLVMAVCFCAGTGTAAEPTNITGPTTIDSPGIYRLNHSFFGPYNDTFITITADDVILDGHGWMIKSNGSSPAGTGIFVDGTKNITIACILLNNFEDGCVISSGSEVTLWGVNAFDSGSVGIKLYNAANCTVDSCQITENNGTGLEIEKGTLNLITNNYFKNTENVRFINAPLTNFWNRTKTTETNILGGSFVGGNVWTNPAGDGWSDTCADGNKDGFCDKAYKLNGVNVDFLPLSLEQPAPTPLKTAFEAGVTSGDAPLTVQFTDTSTGNPLEWKWEFGDDNTSTEQNPIHVYEEAGTYDVTLTIMRGEETDKKTLEAYIEVNEPGPSSLEANFTADMTAGDVPLTVQFTDTSTGDPTAWAWEFGDGANSSLQHPEHTYKENGTYHVTLTVSNLTTNSTLTCEDYVVVGAAAPKTLAANFTTDVTSGKTPLTVHFTDTSTGNVTAWEWNFGDGTGTSSLQHPTYVYKKAGTYAVSLIVSDGATNDTLTRTGFIKVTAPSSSSSTRRSGSGGGGSSSRSHVGFSGNLDTGDLKVFRFSGMGVSEIEITAADHIDEIRLSLEKVSSGPAGLDCPVYQYLLANMTYAKGENLNEIVFFFNLPRSWLSKYGVGAEDIILWRNHDEIWKPLRTELVKETDVRAYYRAVTPGFSYFAIAVGEGLTVIPEGLAEENATSEEPVETITTETVPSEPAGTGTTPLPSSVGVVAAVAALVGVGFVVLVLRRH